MLRAMSPLSEDQIVKAAALLRETPSGLVTIEGREYYLLTVPEHPACFCCRVYVGRFVPRSLARVKNRRPQLL